LAPADAYAQATPAADAPKPPRRRLPAPVSPPRKPSTTRTASRRSGSRATSCPGAR
jgi:hypothetical protein